MSKSLGQYFTTDKTLQNVVVDMIKNDPDLILEPSVGQGHLVKNIREKYPNIMFDMYEIDTDLTPIDGIDKDEIAYEDFLTAELHEMYDTIVGNPPFVQTSSGNLYVKFIEKCFTHLNIAGELIFIVPSDFIKLTSAKKILKRLISSGTFTHIYHPNDENLFSGASINVMIFRYCKDSSLAHQTIYNNVIKHMIETDGIITFHDDIDNLVSLGDYFTAHVGMVSGKEVVFKNSTLGNIEVITGKDKIEQYIYLDEFPSTNITLNEYMLEYKSLLLARKIKNFNETNWYEWGAPRNISTITSRRGENCIYVHNLSRKSRIAFSGEVMY